MTVLRVHVPSYVADGWLPPDRHEVADYWLPKLGPTAHLLAVNLHRVLAPHRGSIVEVDVGLVARTLGVRPAKITSSLDRLHRREIVYFIPDGLVVMGDFMFPFREDEPIRKIGVSVCVPSTSSAFVAA